MLLIFRLGRPDVLPVTDYGVRKGFALTFQRVPKSRPLEAADLPKPDVSSPRKRWAPFRSVASWYLWRACDLAKTPRPPAVRPIARAADGSAVELTKLSHRRPQQLRNRSP
jgi:DNA-3-methyladenine glycosylase II